MNKPILKFAAEDGLYSERAQIISIHWRVEAIATEMGAGIALAQRRDEFGGQPRGGMHRQIESDKLRVANCGVIQRLPRQIKAGDGMTAFAQPRSGRREAEGLPPKLVR